LQHPRGCGRAGAGPSARATCTSGSNPSRPA
jgi:hypothetical protein